MFKLYESFQSVGGGGGGAGQLLRESVAAELLGITRARLCMFECIQVN